jgi:hypothetical protein
MIETQQSRGRKRQAKEFSTLICSTARVTLLSGFYFSLKRGRHKIDDRQSMKIGQNERVTANHTELITICQALTHMEQIWNALSEYRPEEKKMALPAIIASDNITALRALSQPARQSGKSIVRRACEIGKRLKDQGGPVIYLQWVPGRSAVGSKIAHDLAKHATTESLPVTQTTTIAHALRQAKNTIGPRQKEKFAIDSALPENHTRLLYDTRKYKEANILC